MDHRSDNGPNSQSYGFSSSHVWMWELDHKENWVLKNWCFWAVGLEKTLSPLDCKEIKSVNPKGNQSWILIWRTDAEAPILWPPDVKNWFVGKDWRQEEKWMTEDEMIGWHHRLDECELEQAPGVGDRQGSLMRCSLWVARSQTQLSNWTELTYAFRTIKAIIKHGFPVYHDIMTMINFSGSELKFQFIVYSLSDCGHITESVYWPAKWGQ